MRHLLALLALVASSAAAAAEEGVLLMFGSAKTPEEQRALGDFRFACETNAVFAGKPQGWCFNEAGGFTYADANVGSIPADNLLAHGVACIDGTVLRIPYRSGKCRVHLWTGDWFRGIQRFQLIRDAAGRKATDAKSARVWIRVNGRKIYEDRLTPKRAAARWCKLEDYVFSRHDDIWDRIVKPVCDEFDFEAVAKDGFLEISLEKILLAAVAVEPDEAAMAATLAKVEAARRAEFAKRYPWKPLADEPLPENVPADAELVFFKRDSLWCVHPWTRPPARDVTDRISAPVARGERANLRFGVLPLRDLTPLAVEVGAFAAGDGTSAPAGAISFDLWRERYKEPHSTGQTGLLPKTPRALDPTSWLFQPNAPQNGEAGTPRMYSVDVSVATNAPAGVYRAPVVVKAGDRTVRRAELAVEVLPFALRTDGSAQSGFQQMGGLWPEYMPTGGEPCKANTVETPRFLNEHGFDYFHLFILPKGLFFGIRGELGESHVFQTPAHRKIMDETLKTIDPKKRLRYVTLEFDRMFRWAGWKGDIERIRDTPADREWRAKCRALELKDITVLCRELDGIFRAAGWPKVYWYFGGEMDNFGREACEQGVDFARALRKAGCETYSVINGENARKLFPAEVDHVWANPATPITAEFVETLAKHGHKFGAHNCGDTRFMAGLYFWRSGAEGRYQETCLYTAFLWPYCYLPWNYNTALAMPAPDGGLRPTLDFLNYRDALTDYLYLHTLEKTAAESPAGSPVRAEAEAFLEGLRKRISFDPLCYFGAYDAREGNPEAMNLAEWGNESISRVRSRAAELLAKFAAAGKAAAYAVNLPCRAGATETYYLDLAPLAPDAGSLRLVGPDGTDVAFSLDARLDLGAREEDTPNYNGRFCRDRAPWQADKFRKLGWLSFRAPAGASYCTLKFTGGRGGLREMPDREIRPWWIDIVKEPMFNFIARKEPVFFPASKFGDVSRAGGRNVFAWLRAAVPDIPGNVQDSHPFSFEINFFNGKGVRNSKAATLMLGGNARTNDYCVAGTVANDSPAKFRDGSGLAFWNVNNLVETHLVEVHLQLPPETRFNGVKPVRTEFLPGDTLHLTRPPAVGRETRLKFVAGPVKGERIFTPQGSYGFRGYLRDSVGNVVLSWKGKSVRLDDVVPGAYTATVHTLLDGQPLVETQTAVTILAPR